MDILVLQSNAIVSHSNLHFFFRFTDSHFHFTAIESKLESVGKQVVHYFVKLDPVNPCQHVVTFVFEGKSDVTLAGTVLIEFTDISNEIDHIGLTAVKWHLVFVYATLIENLINQ